MNALHSPVRYTPQLFLSAFDSAGSAAVRAAIAIEAGPAVAKVSPMHYGLMTEEINHCYDGGLYAELIQNRAFLDNPETPENWSAVLGAGAEASLALDASQPLNQHLPVSLRLEVNQASESAPAGVANTGYWGIPVYPETRYKASFYAKAAPGFSGAVSVAIQGEEPGIIYAASEVAAISGEWKRYDVVLQTGKVTPTKQARFVLSVCQPGTIWFSLVSLFPPTWNNRPNGLRKDLMQMLVDLKPKYLRFPGGNYLEGDFVETRFKWWETIGPVEGRPGHPCCWGYRSTDGMGLLEFLLWCEDMGAEPLLGVYCGYSLKGDYIEPGPALEPYVQEALDEIEYILGDASTKWGARRAQDGHPEPFKMSYVEIGNEDWFDRSLSYDGRYAQFHDAIKAKYPHLKLISSIGLEHRIEKRVRIRKPDVVDEHYYKSTEEFLAMAGYYERYDRNGSEIFVGEWGAHEYGDIRPWDPRAKQQPPTPNMKAAIGDAAWMIEMERNSDAVVMQCYAPLLVNVSPGAWQWRPDLIGYDALTAYGSPSYHAFKMFSNNVGDEILRAWPSETSLHVSVTRDSRTREIFIKLVNPEPTEQQVRIELKDVPSILPEATVLTLAAAAEATNSIDAPEQVVPCTSVIGDMAPSFSYVVPPTAVVVLKLQIA